MLVFASILARLKFRAAVFAIVLAVTLYGMFLPGFWPAGIPLGLGLGALTLHICREKNGPASLPPTRLSAFFCYGIATLFGFLALFAAGGIAEAAKRGAGLEETIAGAAVGFFLFPAFKFVRWGIGFHLEAKRIDGKG